MIDRSDIVESNKSTSRQSRRQNLAPGVSPGIGAERHSSARYTGWLRGSHFKSLETKRALRASVATVLVTLIGFALTALARRTEPNEQQMQVPDSGDYSKFRHDGANHARLPCLLCHRRESNSARPAIPGGSNHLPCAGCHVKQFADSGNAICTICHSNPQSGALKQFPRLSSFNMRFDHARHTRMGGVGCLTCHRPSHGGVTLTIPAGFNAHVTCFQCHGPQAKSGERDISSCGVCHEPGHRVRTPEMASAFRVGFSHAKHNKDEGLSCNDCHRVRTGVARLQVTAPQALNHHASPASLSCMSCHNGKRAFGGDDFSACKRCHSKESWRF